MNIELLDICIHEEPIYSDKRYAIIARFIDTQDIRNYDKGFCVANDDLTAALEQAGYRAGCVLSMETPKDIEELNKLFAEYV
jgi:hypothetical protein